jgi:hypothetical protein
MENRFLIAMKLENKIAVITGGNSGIDSPPARFMRRARG